MWQFLRRRLPVLGVEGCYSDVRHFVSFWNVHRQPLRMLLDRFLLWSALCQLRLVATSKVVADHWLLWRVHDVLHVYERESLASQWWQQPLFLPLSCRELRPWPALCVGWHGNRKACLMQKNSKLTLAVIVALSSSFCFPPSASVLLSPVCERG